MDTKDIEKAASDISQMYEDLYQLIDQWSEESMNPHAIGAALMTTALRLYRTTLNDDDYNKFIDYLSDSRDRIEKFNAETLVSDHTLN